MKCCPDYCLSCKEHHLGDCPPHEVRTTGVEWLRQRIHHLEFLLTFERYDRASCRLLDCPMKFQFYGEGI